MTMGSRDSTEYVNSDISKNVQRTFVSMIILIIFNLSPTQYFLISHHVDINSSRQPWRQ